MVIGIISGSAKVEPPPTTTSATLEVYMSYSLNSFKGAYIGDYIGDYYRGY